MAKRKGNKWLLIVILILILVIISLIVISLFLPKKVQTIKFQLPIPLNSSWGYCKTITIKNWNSSATLNNFPVLIHITDTANMQNHGEDLRFIDNSCRQEGKLLPHEIENFTTDNAYVWVATDIYDSQATIAMYYYNSEASDAQNSTGVWDSNYVMVQHMNENAGILYDSSSNDNDCSPINSPLYQQEGIADGATNFQAIDQDYFNCGDIDVTQVTAEVWLRNDTVMSDAYPYSKGDGYVFSSWWFRWYNYQTVSWYVANSACNDWQYLNVDYRDVTNTYEFSYWVGVYNTSIGIGLYKNGNLSIEDTARGGMCQSNYNVYLDRGVSGIEYWSGSIDEVRLSNIVRNSNWIMQTYQVIANNSNYVTIGSEMEINY